VTRQQIADTIASLQIGDAVIVSWADSANNGINKSSEAGKVWQPPDSNFLGVGPDLLDPDDPELVGITVVSRSPVVIPQPPIGSVAVWVLKGVGGVHAYKRLQKGWYPAGATGPVPWSMIVAAFKAPSHIIQPGSVPAAPTINTLTPGTGKLTVNATLGSAGSSPITDVEYALWYTFFEETQQETTGWVSTGQTTGTFDIVNLEGGLPFSVRIRAINDNGIGAESNLVTGTPL
jgi:hypothetical protein